MLTDWQKHATNAIATGLLEYEAQQLCLGESVEAKVAIKWVSANKYPFGQRANHLLPSLVIRVEDFQDFSLNWHSCQALPIVARVLQKASKA